MADQPTYTRVTNALLELLPTLPDAECRIMLVVARKTLGWQKAADEISNSQFRTATGMSKQGVINGIRSATKRGILKQTPSGHNNEFCYEIILDQGVHEVDHLEGYTKLTPDDAGGTRSRPEGVHEVDHLGPQGVHEVDTQKKDLKERKERDSGTRETRSRTPRESQEKTPTPIVIALADVCKIDQKLGTKEQKLQLNTTARDLYQAGVAAGKTVDEIGEAIRYVGRHWQANHWKGKKGELPWPKDIRENWRAAIEARAKNGYANGAPLTATKPAAPPDAQPAQQTAARMLELIAQQRGGK